MANEEQARILRLGHDAWANWRRKHESTVVDLSDADLCRADLHRAYLTWANLRGADLSDANLGRADLRRANLCRANLRGVDLSGASLGDADLSGADLGRANLRGTDLRGTDLSDVNLSDADLSGADLGRATLSDADLCGADLHKTDLHGAYLRGVDLRGANLASAILRETVLIDLDLSGCKGLESCIHSGPTPIDIRTLQRSGPLPLAFLRGVGLPDTLIDALPSLLSHSIQFYSCFISYSAKDEKFVRQLHADLQDKGVRCWFAPEDMKIGAKILDTLNEAIRLRDKVLLVLSGASIASDWVEDEVTKAFAEERQRGGVVLFPVRVDDAVFATNEAWALKLRDNRNIGDFRRWQEHDAYQRTLDRLLRDLRAETPDAMQSGS